MPPGQPRQVPVNDTQTTPSAACDAPVYPVDPFTFVLHGASGDLARRKILPALAHLAQGGYFPAECRIILSQRQEVTPADALAQQDAFLREIGDDAALRALPSLQPLVRTVAVDIGGDAGSRSRLDAAIADAPRPIIHYAALPASRYVDLMALIKGERDPARLRVVLEKPLGRSGDDSRQIEEVVARCLDESQVFRIDHYLGKQAVQNLMALRLGNLIFEPLLTRQYVAHVQITLAEDLGVGDRAGFYEQTGALRDMVQSHMLQLLAMVAMEPPVSLEADAVRDEKLKILASLAHPSVGGRESDVVIGQYVAGHVRGEPVPGYKQEQGVPPRSLTETFVAIRAEVNTWRWAGVPFLLRTGKRMPGRFAEISVQFRDVPLHLYTPLGDHWAGNRLVVQLQPEDRLQMHLLAKVPGQRERLQPVALNLDFSDAWRIPVRDAYERLLTDIIRGRLSLFLRRDEVEAQWRFVDRLRTDLRERGVHPLAYPAGSYGPPEATALAVRSGGVWSESLSLVT